jgi:hypothetical protein
MMTKEDLKQLESAMKLMSKHKIEHLKVGELELRTSPLAHIEKVQIGKSAGGKVSEDDLYYSADKFVKKDKK